MNYMLFTLYSEIGVTQDIKETESIRKDLSELGDLIHLLVKRESPDSRRRKRKKKKRDNNNNRDRRRRGRRKKKNRRKGKMRKRKKEKQPKSDEKEAELKPNNDDILSKQSACDDCVVLLASYTKLFEGKAETVSKQYNR